ncbi:MAG: PD-(D/E)XK nuclease family protein [Gemmatimonadaceae bacterium]|nr:PD-(D/E)XK nuclease family protein [Gemmatimonadaceae bacterium]NUR19678.1 PD-(D/E)XK nuclease family protein [Gemmatimonadaceae bacterium]NUS97179.1 PD-(D/E)XK nuclease family protein [Gemmatimonadaceae bacterium]
MTPRMAHDEPARPRTPAGEPSRLLASLIQANAAHPTSRKRLLGPDVNYGRELLVSLARITGGWIGWEAVNLRGIAEQLAFVPLARAGRRAGSDIEIGALVSAALDAAIATDTLDPRFVALQGSLGFRHAVRDAVLELRTAGVAPAELRAAAKSGTPAYDLASVVEHFERILAASGLVDPAGIFRAALDAFDAEAPFVLDGATFVAPGLVARGLAGELLERLLAHGAHRLDGDDALGAAVAGASFFSAATPSDELREVLRRAIAEGTRWDEIEIVTCDVDTYGVALDALCQRVGVGATMLQGIPLARTRLGRAIDRWFAWLGDGLAADVLREALEAGEMHLPDSDLPSSALARELRRQRIGWGRARYESAIASLAAPAAPERHEDESDEEYASRSVARVRGGRALSSFLTRLLAATPPVPERGSHRPVRIATSALAELMLRWMELLPIHGMAEDQTKSRITTRVRQLAAIEQPEVPFSSAVAALRDALADVRAWPLVTEERKPWSASGGMVHLTDLAHAGTTGRPHVFVVGLDADRTSGAARPDPFLTDTIRGALGAGRLPTSADRREERARLLGSALAALRGDVTLSYATSGSLDGREAGPAPVLLECWRFAEQDQSLTFEMLRERLRPPACAVPDAGDATLDGRDVWLGAIADGPLLLDGTEVVRECFAGLDAGLRAAEAAASPDAGAHHGIVLDAIGELDLVARGRSVSPSSLELLAKCPLAWFYRNGLGLRPPVDPAYDAEAWLDALARGSLLHEVYEAMAKHYIGRQREILADDAQSAILRIADEAIARWRVLVPPPGESVFEAEVSEIRRAALAFLEMERRLVRDGDDGEWWKLEVAFGDAEGEGVYDLGQGRKLRVRGRADRVDRLRRGGLRVVDYKTGGAKKYQKSPKKAPFDGGRQLQPAIYSAALKQVLGERVARFEYRFPTERGESEIVAYDEQEMGAAVGIVRALLEQAESGAFLPTTDPSDCGYCDCAPICRTRTDGYGKTSSPRAEWAKANVEQEVFRIMRALRGVAGAAEESE